MTLSSHPVPIKTALLIYTFLGNVSRLPGVALQKRQRRQRRMPGLMHSLRFLIRGYRDNGRAVMQHSFDVPATEPGKNCLLTGE